MKVSELRTKLRRQAIVMELGGFRPPEAPQTSWFGRVLMGLPGESWPHSGAEPMHALCQINLTELPFLPPFLDDLEMITVFIGPKELPIEQPNGINWCLRAYKDISQLQPLEQQKTGSSIKKLPMKPKVIETDFPCLDDVDIDLPDSISDDFAERFENVGGLKLGGWPTLIQSEIRWPSSNGPVDNLKYVFQIDSTEKGNWAWGHGGVAYFGRNTAAEASSDQWAIQWQCY